MKISVIIPCYNVADFLEECLESVCDQTLPPAEIICVDNNSTDNTWSQLQELQMSRFPQLILLQEANRGACFARNRGLAAATSPWIQFLDADDLLLPRKLEHQARLLSTLSCTGYLAGTYVRRSVSGDETLVTPRGGNQWTAAFLSCAGITSSNLWNRIALLEVGGWDNSLKSSQESELMMRLALAEKSFVTDSGCLTIIRERESGQISQTKPGPRYTRFLEVRLNYLKKLKEFFPQQYKANKKELLTCLVANLLILSKQDPAVASRLSKEIPWTDWKPASGYGMAYWKAFLIKYTGWSGFFRFFSILQSK